MNGLQFGYNNGRVDHYINATAGGLVNLSGVTTLSSYDDDLLHITAAAGERSTSPVCKTSCSTAALRL